VKNTVSQIQFTDNTTRMGLVTYGETPNTILTLDRSNDAATISNALNNIRSVNGEADVKALLETVKSMFKNQGVESNGKYLVVFLNSDVNTKDVEELRKTLKKLAINLMVVDVGQNNLNVDVDGDGDSGDGGDEAKDKSNRVEAIRPDDINSIFSIIIDGLKLSAKDEGKTDFL